MPFPPELPRPGADGLPVDRTPKKEHAGATHRIRARFPEGTPNRNTLRFTTEPAKLAGVISDEARFPGGNTPGMVELTSGAGSLEVSSVLRLASPDTKFVAIGTQTSLTGAAVPKGEVVLNMGTRKEIEPVVENERGEKLVKVQSGVTLAELQDHLRSDGLFFPSAPTYDGATVVGAISTDGAGASSYKYGKTRRYVEGLTMVLPTGEEISMKRGQYLAKPGENGEPDYFEMLLESDLAQDPDAKPRKIPVPTYQMPDVPKVSAGYYAKQHEPGEQHGMDLIDLVVGSEGTLGVITDATIKVLPEPPTTMALVLVDSDATAFSLIKDLRDQEPEKRASLEPGGIRAVEFIGTNALQLVKDHGEQRVPKRVVAQLGDAKAMLLVQIETPDGEDGVSMQNFQNLFVASDGENVRDGVHDILVVTPEAFVSTRESVPQTVNHINGINKTRDSAVTKVGVDPCVRPEDLGALTRIFDEEFGQLELPMYVWGHGEGNLHVNFLPTSGDQVKEAMAAVKQAGIRVIREQGGTGTAEHGVGKNKTKQDLLRELYGEKGLAQMRAVKEAFDPRYRLAPDNIFPASKPIAA